MLKKVFIMQENIKRFRLNVIFLIKKLKEKTVLHKKFNCVKMFFCVLTLEALCSIIKTPFSKVRICC